MALPKPKAEKRVLKSGRIVYYARYLGPDGKTKTEVGPEGAFRNKRDAERYADKRRQQVLEETWQSADMLGQTFTEYVDKYYWPTTSNLEANTVETYKIYLDTVFTPRFGHMMLSMIQPSTIQAWINDFKQTHEPKTVHNYHAFLHKVFARAVIDKAKATNPCADSELPKIIKRKKRIISPEEFELLIKAIPDEHLLLVNLAIESGERWGELMGFRACDLEPATNLITVNQTIVELRKDAELPKGYVRLMHADDTPSRYAVKPHPKDDEAREIGLEAATIKMIQTYMMANGVRDEDRLFTTARGFPLSRNTFRTRVWLPAIEEAKLPKGTTFHHLRAAHASWLLAGGADLQTVMERLGHRLITTTQQYLGTLPDANDRALSAFAKIRNRTVS